MSTTELVDYFIPKEVDTTNKHSSCTIYERVNLTSEANLTIKPCPNGWEYDYTIWYPTPVSEQNWVCEESWKSLEPHTIHSVGNTIGAVAIGLLADHFGRVRTAAFTFSLCGLAGLGTIVLVKSFTLLSFCRALSGFCAFQGITLQILAMEYMGIQGRFWACTGLGISLSLTNGLLPWIAYWIGDWKLLAGLTSLPMFLVPVLCLFTPESFRWQLSKGKVDEAKKTLKRVAKINDRLVPDTVIDQLTACNTSCKEAPLHHIFKYKRLCFIFFTTTLAWTLVASTFIGSAIQAATLTEHPFIILSVYSVLDILANFAAQWGANHFGRRSTTMFAGLLGSLAYLTTPFVPLEQSFFFSELVFLGRFAAGLAWAVQLPYGAEVFPTPIRSRAIAIRFSFGAFGNIFVPSVIPMKQFGPQTPLIFFGLLMTTLLGVSGFLPETLGQPMPETLEEGNRLGLKRRPVVKERVGITNLSFVSDTSGHPEIVRL